MCALDITRVFRCTSHRHVVFILKRLPGCHYRDFYISTLFAYVLSNKRNCAWKKLLHFFQPSEIAHWNKLLMKVPVILQMNNPTWNLQKAFFVFSEVAENWLARIEVTNSVPHVSSLCINHCWAYSPHGANDTCVKVVQDDNAHLHDIFIKLLQICWLLKAGDADDEISTPTHPTRV